MITPIYASLVALIFLFLTYKVIEFRRSEKVSIGANDSVLFQRIIRGHSNLAEYAPIALLLILMMELQSESTWLVHLTGIMLVLGRAAHAYAFTQEHAMRPRQIGMVLTLFAILFAIIGNLILSLT